MSAHSELWPQGVNLTAFTKAYDLQRAVAETLRIKATASVDSSLSTEQSSRRQAILEIVCQLLIKERNLALDEFCASWLKSRKL